MVHYRLRLMRYLALLLFPVELIRLLHRLFFAAVGDQIVNNHNCEVIEFHDQDTTSFLARTSEVKPSPSGLVLGWVTGPGTLNYYLSLFANKVHS